MRIRTVATASGKHAVQVVSKQHGHLTVHKHVGTWATQQERERCLEEARVYISSSTNQQDLFADTPDGWRLGEIAIKESRPFFLYDLLSRAYDAVGFCGCSDGLIKDLILARVYAPASKRETAEILSDVFAKPYALKTIYRHLRRAVGSGLRDCLQRALIQTARTKFTDALHLVFYDVTTLAFASTVKTTLKNFGYSKDHRREDTQVVVGLVVTKTGFPLYFDVFSGNTFEGNTFVTVVESIRRLLGSPDLVVVADAGMLSRANMDALDGKGIGFVVGARLATLPIAILVKSSAALAGCDGATTEMTRQGYRLLMDYTSSRAAKDRHDRDGQMERAKKALERPSTVTRRYRFLKPTATNGYELNTALVDKATLLEGMRGYLTNTKLDGKTIIDRYHDLWRVEYAFRLTKSDLEARPIFHRLDETIKAHLTIVFAALAVSRYLEINTGMSIRAILKLAGKLLTHTVINTKTGETTIMETTITDPDLCGKLERLRSLGH